MFPISLIYDTPGVKSARHCERAPFTLAARGRAGGTFFPVVVLCQFLVLAGNGFWFYILMYLCTGFTAGFN